jgi:hypothetical protein
VKIAIAVAFAAAACTSKDPIAKLEAPETCIECHKTHYDQWSGSMHAYASDDPVFVAMNRRGQRDTAGQLGTFCVQCHAPMAVALGLVDAGNAASFDPTMLPSAARGVTCYFCHNVAKVTADHNNGIALAFDRTMRAGAHDPVDSPAHDSKYDPLMDHHVDRSEMCGSCHDVVTPRGVALERTYQEWQTTMFTDATKPLLYLTCGSGCHMGSSTDVIADKPGLNVTPRNYGFHEHVWPGVDQALIQWPQTDVMTMDIARDLFGAVSVTGARPPGGGPSDIPGGVCLVPLGGGQITVRLDSIQIGHNWPSGAAQDRRAWLEVVAYDASGAVVFHTGDVPDGTDPEAAGEPDLFGLWDRTARDDGNPAHFFWDVASYQPGTLRPPLDPYSDHSTTATYGVATVFSRIDRITTIVHVRPLPFAVLDDLIGSGDLDPGVRSQMKTLDLDPGTRRQWSRAGQDPASGCCPAGLLSC